MKKLALSCLFIHPSQSYSFTHHQQLLHRQTQKVGKYRLGRRSGSSRYNDNISVSSDYIIQHHKRRLQGYSVGCRALYAAGNMSANFENVAGSNTNNNNEAENMIENDFAQTPLSLHQHHVQYDNNNKNNNDHAWAQTHPNQLNHQLDQEEQYQKQKRKMEKRLNNRIKVSIATLSVFTAFFLLVVLSGPGQWRYYLAGGICAAVSHAVTTPVDVIKTRKQVDDSMKDMGLIQSGYKIIKDDKEGGINALLAGLGPTTIGYLFEGAVKFGVYEVFKPIIQSFLQRASIIFNIGWFDSKIIGFVLSGSLAGFAASIMLCPMEALRIRMVAEPEFAATGNCVECGIEMINNEGIMGLWKCLPSMLFKQVPYTVTKNVSFDLITTFAYGTVAELGRNICGRTKFIIPLVSAMIASVLSCISSQPGDMLLSVINAHKGKLTNRDHVRNIMKENGIGGFFIGIRERFVHVGLIVTVQLLIYDFVKRLVGITATGL